MNKILIEKIKQDLRTLRLKDMAETLETCLAVAEREKQGHLEFFAQLVQKQLEAVQKRSLERRVKSANFPRNMTFDNFDWNFQPGLNIEQLKNLKELGFVINHQPLLIFGKSGCGKSHIAASLGIEACRSGFRVGYYKLQELLALLYATLADDSTDEVIGKLARLDVLIIDHVGYIRKKDEYASLLLDVVCSCQDRVSLIVTTSISLEEWGMAFGNNAITNDIVDRLFHRAIVINIRYARSYRTEGPNAPKISPPDKTSS
jgi:DNA replication protein DnaC